MMIKEIDSWSLYSWSWIILNSLGIEHWIIRLMNRKHFSRTHGTFWAALQETRFMGAGVPRSLADNIGGGSNEMKRSHNFFRAFFLNIVVRYYLFIGYCSAIFYLYDAFQALKKFQPPVFMILLESISKLIFMPALIRTVNNSTSLIISGNNSV